MYRLRKNRFIKNLATGGSWRVRDWQDWSRQKQQSSSFCRASRVGCSIRSCGSRSSRARRRKVVQQVSSRESMKLYSARHFWVFLMSSSSGESRQWSLTKKMVLWSWWCGHSSEWRRRICLANDEDDDFLGCSVSNGGG
ncbi:hypothetical protein TorRG33x02_312560 [Trema orientale]|uniref:Uncharacterized protein n=1 Tax=Trema orientale TaxID=63057 RepID=A0A2P5BQL0_TREOI|nr:hypothetical protein TorRG33x02_312560 [Trema orientale]